MSLSVVFGFIFSNRNVCWEESFISRKRNSFILLFKFCLGSMRMFFFRDRNKIFGEECVR